MRKLLIDDIRDRGDVAAIARTVEMAQDLLNGPHHFDLVYLDHDLGSVETGDDLLKWMFERFIRPSSFILVTMNPVGRKNMEATLKDNGYIFAGGAWQDNIDDRYEKRMGRA